MWWWWYSYKKDSSPANLYPSAKFRGCMQAQCVIGPRLQAESTVSRRRRRRRSRRRKKTKTVLCPLCCLLFNVVAKSRSRRTPCSVAKTSVKPSYYVLPTSRLPTSLIEGNRHTLSVTSNATTIPGWCCLFLLTRQRSIEGTRLLCTR